METVKFLVYRYSQKSFFEFMEHSVIGSKVLKIKFIITDSSFSKPRPHLMTIILSLYYYYYYFQADRRKVKQPKGLLQIE